MLPAILIIAALFALLFVARVGGARRSELMRRWPAVTLAGAALFAVLRGAIWPGIALAALAILAWTWWPAIERLLQKNQAPSTAPDAEDATARALLGVGAAATAAEIRAAYRTKMAQAHPDRGGKHADAARLTAARDRLLKKLG